MFGWLFRPSCPCDPAAKAWVEERLEWLAEEFDDNAFSDRRIVLPTSQFFPDPYDKSLKAVRALLNRVCGYMDVVPSFVRLKLVNRAGGMRGLVDEMGNEIPTTAGTYEEDDKFIIRIDKSELEEPMQLVGTLAHELAHARRLGESRIMSEIYDNELLTDLTVVHFWLGIFLANVPRTWASQYSKWPNSNLIKPEYMTPPMFGWALAHLAWFRGEQKPERAPHLNSDAKANFKQGLKYLHETEDSEYKPLRLRRKGK